MEYRYLSDSVAELSYAFIGRVSSNFSCIAIDRDVSEQSEGVNFKVLIVLREECESDREEISDAREALDDMSSVAMPEIDFQIVVDSTYPYEVGALHPILMMKPDRTP